MTLSHLLHYVEGPCSSCTFHLERIPLQQPCGTGLSPNILSVSKIEKISFYAVYPTLDLNSANQRIVISSDHSMASMNGIDQQYPEHQDRFTSCKQVLAKESFFSGLYYWEVDVTRARDYEIGIASESMLRIGGGWECSLGCNANSWCVAKHDGKYTARHDGSETNLNMLGDPKHLGLCLDCDQGDLVFYAINYSFSWPMHTFHLDVNEPLRPALGLCNVGDALPRMLEN
uniref:B30.2/SPRY domain-containing protein n=1 Tax=Eptatretus burgeri TaxID=7764 RepID=A0A8C4NCK4_EPTBU